MRQGARSLNGHPLDAALSAHRAGRLELAEQLYVQAIATAPLDSDLWHLLGLVRHQRHEPGAAALIARALALAPATGLYLGNLGIALAAAGQQAAAEAAQWRAFACQALAAEAHDRLGRWLRDTGRVHHALRMQRRALALAPAAIVSLTEIGHSNLELGEVDAAARLYRRTLAVDPASSEARFALGNSLKALGRRAAVAVYRQALAIVPAAKEVIANLAETLQSLGMPAPAARLYRRALAAWPATEVKDPRFAFLGSNLIFCLCYDPDVANADLYAETRRWERRHATPLYRLIRPHANTPDPERRLKLGYLSADLRAHPVAFSLDGLLRRHDPAAVEVHCYAEVARPDAVTQRLMGHVPQWRSTVGRSDEEVAETIRADGIDILAVVAGHTAGNRLRLCALKPAPVQVSMYDITTSGLATVDHWLTDRHHAPPDISESFVETLVRLPCIYLHEPPERSPDIGPSPAAASGVVTFASFNNPAKLNARVIALWARVLAAVPESRLLLGYQRFFADPERAAQIRDAFVRQGVAPERLVFVGNEPGRQAHLHRLNLVDIALDPFPFAGCTTTFEALWMGVPVVSLIGKRFLGRIGLCHLSMVGLERLAAADEDAYVRIAGALAADIGGLAALRVELRRRVAASPLLDAPAYARAMEMAFRQMWRTWCAAR
jgi:protein O-GlcNAc transferase